MIQRCSDHLAVEGQQHNRRVFVVDSGGDRVRPNLASRFIVSEDNVAFSFKRNTNATRPVSLPEQFKSLPVQKN
jgi:hypothetical protein